MREPSGMEYGLATSTDALATVESREIAFAKENGIGLIIPLYWNSIIRYSIVNAIFISKHQ